MIAGCFILVRMRELAISARYHPKGLTARPSFDFVHSHRLCTPPVQVFFRQYNKTTFAGRLVVLVRMRGLEPPRGCPH